MFDAIIQPTEKNKKSKIIKIVGCDKKKENISTNKDQP